MRLFFRLWLAMFLLAALWPVIPPRPAAAQTYYYRDWYAPIVDALDPYYTVEGNPCYEMTSGGGSYTVTRINANEQCNGLVYNRWFSAYDVPTVSAAFANANELVWMFDYVRTNNNTDNSHDRIWKQQTITGFGNRLEFIGGLNNSDTCQNSVYWAEATGEITVMGCSISLDYQDSVTLSNFRIRSINPFSDITPTPTSPPATAFPVTQACIPGNLLPTRTPTAAARTPTPFGTRTPTATATLTATVVPATPAPAGLNILTDFTGSLSPWTQNGVTPFVAHSTDIGPNSQPGIVRMPFSSAPTENTPGQLSPPNITPGGNLLIYERLNMPRQLRVIADVQFPEMLSGTYTYIQVFYWPDDGLGTAAWVLAGNIRVNAAWHKITFYMNVPNTYGHPRAVALRAVSGMSTIDNPLGFAPQAASGSVQLDNLRLVAGAEANDPTATGLPVCGGTGGGTGSTQPVTKICQIAVNTRDVFASCTTPASLLDIGAWINWLWCRVSRYFSFLQENRQQIESLQSRQQNQQPVGPLLELPSVIQILTAILQDINATNNANAVYYRQFDFNRILDFGAWGSGDIFQIDFNAINTNIPDSRFDCEIGFSNLPVGMRRGVCFATNTVRESTPIIPAIQWLADIGAVVMLISYFRNTWMSKNE